MKRALSSVTKIICVLDALASNLYRHRKANRVRELLVVVVFVFNLVSFLVKKISF